MIINHNIAALNTYRQLSSNQNITQKSLEKLSSGLRINRAGDDAAGLAISEKMRAQIRGLDQAARNAQDGISMIQTAEGALNEVHAILQRMRELANQAANDTNVDVDRNEIQKEINQLTSEINRIGNTTEFNTQKLLNGGKQIDANVTVSAKTLIGGLDAGNVNASATETNLGEDAVQGTFTSGDITLASANGASTLEVGGITITINWDETSGTFDPATHISGVNGSGATGTVTLALDRGQSQANAATAIAAALNAVIADAGYTGSLKGATITANGNAVDITVASNVEETTANALKFVATAGGGTGFTVAQHDQDITAQVSTSVPGAELDKDAVAASGNIRFNIGDGVPAEGTNIVIANKVIAFYDSSSGNYDDAEHAKSALSADYVVDIYGITDGAGIAQAVVNAINTEPISGYQIKVNDTNADQVDITATTAAASGLSANQLAAVNNNAVPTAATGSITFTSVPTEGASITIGDSTIGFYDSNSGTYADANAAKEALGTDYVIDINGKTTVNQIKDAILALDPQISQVTMADGGVGKIDITAAVAGAAGNQISLAGTNDETSGFEAKFQIGANYAQSMTIDINDMRAAALGVSSTTEGGEVIAKDGAKANYIAIEAKVTNGTDNDGIEYALDVSTHDKATAAISVINDAIEAVSAERSKLGAFQNRLEHTINNLGTSSENLTAAESRIRDVDMAKEMMEFTKMNILSQAAQAMLAQANQMPQGVLQLLR